MNISAGSNETQVGMTRCAVSAALSGGTFRAPGPRIGRSVMRPFPRLHGAGTPQRGAPTFTSV